MRLREPFSGYMLIEGHVVTHLSMLFGSFNAYFIILQYEDIHPDQIYVLKWLILAHIVTPISMWIRSYAMSHSRYVLANVLQIFSVILNTITVFYAQYFQINHETQEEKLTHLNMWFIIETLVFYGYIVSAMGFIAQT
jgi:O-antigen/teichoic acid export membrane protein